MDVEFLNRASTRPMVRFPLRVLDEVFNRDRFNYPLLCAEDYKELIKLKSKKASAPEAVTPMVLENARPL